VLVNSDQDTLKHPGGRPTNYTPEIAEQILQNIVAGMPIVAAVNLAGVKYRTFADWRKNNPQFSQRVQEAKRNAAKGLMEQAKLAAYKHPGTIFRLLAYIHPAFLPPATNANLNVSVSGEVKHSHEMKLANVITPEYLQQVAQLISRPELPAPETVDADFTELQSEQPE
jgi:hypothetical protein